MTSMLLSLGDLFVLGLALTHSLVVPISIKELSERYQMEKADLCASSNVTFFCLK